MTSAVVAEFSQTLLNPHFSNGYFFLKYSTFLSDYSISNKSSNLFVYSLIKLFFKTFILSYLINSSKFMLDFNLRAINI